MENNFIEEEKHVKISKKKRDRQNIDNIIHKMSKKIAKKDRYDSIEKFITGYTPKKGNIEEYSVTGETESPEEKIEKIKKKKSKKEESEEDDLHIEISEKFKDHVTTWVKLDNRKKELMLKVSEINKEKKKYEEKILKFMGKSNLDKIAISDGNILRNKDKKPTAVKIENVETVIKENLEDKKLGKKIIDLIHATREIRKSVKLKRTKAKKK